MQADLSRSLPRKLIIYVSTDESWSSSAHWLFYAPTNRNQYSYCVKSIGLLELRLEPLCCFMCWNLFEATRLKPVLIFGVKNILWRIAFFKWGQSVCLHRSRYSDFNQIRAIIWFINCHVNSKYADHSCIIKTLMEMRSPVGLFCRPHMRDVSISIC